MSKKKTAKRVIDYDPLAWMSEGEEDQAEPALPLDRDDTVAQAGEDESWGFFDDVSSNPQPEDPSSAEDDAGYGFFADEESLAVSNSMSAVFDEQSGVVDLGADLSIRSVADCKSIIDQCLASAGEITVATGRLQKIDTAGLQLLLSLDATLRADDGQINWQGDTQLVNDTALRLGLAPFAHGSAATETVAEDPGESDDAGFGFF